VGKVGDQLHGAIMSGRGGGRRVRASLLLVEESPNFGVFQFRFFERDEVAGRQPT